MIRIALDVAGGDFGLAPNISGAVQAAREPGVSVILVGPADEIRKELARCDRAPEAGRLEIVDAPDLIGMDEDPVKACREKPRSSIVAAAELAAQGRAQALVSAGNSGATMVAALWHLKRLPGVLRPAIACPIPTSKGFSVLLDGGANTECKPWHLLQFGMMGSIYARKVLGIERPSIGLLSNGEEESKGTETVREALALLKVSGLNFLGPIEGRDIPAGTTDVIVCDGFTGNICLKLYEGVAKTLLGELKAAVDSNPVYRLGGLLMRPAARQVKRRMSDEEYGGAPLLGVDGTAVICHGKSSPRAVAHAIGAARRLVEGNANEDLRRALADMKSSLEMARVGE